MKNKIYKILSVILALMMIFSACSCVLNAEVAEGDVVEDGKLYPSLAVGSCNGVNLDASNLIGSNDKRYYTVNTYQIADYVDIVVPAGTMAYVQNFDAAGVYKGGSTGTWIKAGTHNLANIAPDGATQFKVTFATASDSGLPSKDGFYFTLVEKEPTPPKTATYYVSAAGSDENDGLSADTAVATYGKALELAAATYGAKDQITVKLIGESVDLGTVPAYAFDLTTEGVEATQTKLSSTDSTVIVAKGSGINRFRNVEFYSSSQYTSFVFGDSRNVILESTVKGLSSAYKYTGLGTYNDGGAATTLNGVDFEANTHVYLLYLGSAGWHQKTFTENVNVTLAGGGSTNLYFAPAANCTTTYKKNFNLNLKNSSGVTFNLDKMGTLKFDGAIQIINSSNATIKNLDGVVKTVTVEEEKTTAPIDKYILNNKSGNANLLAFTETTGKYAVDTVRYTVTATPVAGGDAIVAKDGFLEVPAGEYDVTAIKNVETVTYYVSAAGSSVAEGTEADPLLSIDGAIKKANAAGYIKNDTVYVKVLGTDAVLWREVATTPYLTKHTFKLDISSATSGATVGAKSEAVTSTQVELNGPTKISNIKIANKGTSNDYIGFGFYGNDVEIGEGVTFASYYITYQLGAWNSTNTPNSDKYNNPINVAFKSKDTRYLYLANNYGAATFNEDVNVTVDHASANPILYFGCNNAKATYNANVNINLKQASSISFNPGNSRAFGADAAVQIINSTGKDITYESTVSASLFGTPASEGVEAVAPLVDTYVINNATGVADIISFTDTAGKYAVNAAEGTIVTATPVAGGEAIKSADGFLTVPAGEYNITAKIPVTRTDVYKDFIAYREALNGNNALNNVAAKWNNGEDINVVYYGGSVTNGSGASDADNTSWRGIISNWLTENAPEGTTVNNINSAIGGTGTKFGIYRLKEAVLDKQPDLLFIEFSINDWYDNQVTGDVDAKEAARRFETIIHEVRKALPNCDIVNVLTTEKGLIATNKEGNMHKQAEGHDAVAKEYGIPTLYIGKALANHLPADWESVWSEYVTDIVHPTDKGYEVYANVVTEYISNSLLFDNKEVTEVKAHIMPEVLYSADLIDGNLQVEELNQDIIDASVELGGDEFTLVQSSVHQNFETHVKVLNGNKIAYEFTGTELGIITNTNSSTSDGVEAYTYAVVIKDKESGEEVLNTTVKLNSINPGIIASGLEKGTYIAELTAVFTTTSETEPYAKIGAFTTRDETQKTVQVLPEGKEYTYYVSETGSDETGDGTDAKPFATVAKAIEKANEVRKYQTDTVIIKVCGTAVTLGAFPQHVFNLVVESNDTASITTVNLGAGAMLANNEGAKTTYKNVALNNPNQWQNAFLGSSNVVFGEGATLSGSFLTVSYGTSNDGGANKTIAGQSAEFNCATPYAIVLANGSWSGRTYSEDVNLVINNADSNPFIAFNSYYLSAKSGTTKYKKNVNINLKSAEGVRLYQFDGTTFEGAIQIIDSAGLGFNTVYESTVTSAADPSMTEALAGVTAEDGIYKISNLTGSADVLEFTETAGVYKVNVGAVNGICNIVATAADGTTYTPKNGYLTVPAGEYKITAPEHIYSDDTDVTCDRGCGFERAMGIYFVGATGSDDNGGLTVDTAAASLAGAVQKAIDSGLYGEGDVVFVKTVGADAIATASTIPAHSFKLIVTANDTTVPGKFSGTIQLGGKSEFDYVTIAGGFYFNGQSATFGDNADLGGNKTGNNVSLGKVDSSITTTAPFNIKVANYTCWGINFKSGGYWVGTTHNHPVTIEIDKWEAAWKGEKDGGFVFWGGGDGVKTTFNAPVNIKVNESNIRMVLKGKEGRSIFNEGFALQLINSTGKPIVQTGETISRNDGETETHTNALDFIDDSKEYIITNNTGDKNIINFTDTVGKYKVDFDAEKYALIANGEVATVVDGYVEFGPGETVLELRRIPEYVTYYVGAEGTAPDTFAENCIDQTIYTTIADAIEAAVEADFTAQNTVTIKLLGESVGFGTIPAYTYTLVIESNDPAVRTKATFNGTGGDIANGGYTVYKNVEITNNPNNEENVGEWKALYLNGASVLFDENCKFGVGYGTGIVLGKNSDGDGAVTVAGQTVQIDCALPYSVNTSSGVYAARTYSEDVNIILNGTGTARVIFNAEYNGAENGTTKYNKLVNVYVNGASGIILDNMSAATFETGLQVFNNTTAEVTVAEDQTLPENAWVINNASGKQLIAPDKEYAGIFEILVDTTNARVYAVDAEGNEHDEDTGFLYLDNAGIYTIKYECLEHTWGEATCTEAAKCEVCGVVNEEIPALDHDMQDPTCTEPSKCSRCDYTEGEALGHEYLPESYVSNNDATCQADGTKTAKCTRYDVCGQTDTIADEGTAKHVFTEYVYNEDATCTEDGTKTAECIFGCGETNTVIAEGSKLGHEFAGYVFNEDATCTENGTETANCIRYDECGEVHTREKADSALGHDWEAADCINPKTCKTCGEIEGDALGHDFVDHVCTRCGAGECDGTNHTFDQEVATDAYLVSGATCTAKAVYKKSCVCGEAGTETFEVGELLDHVFDKEVATDAYKVSGATCTAKAVYKKSCVCGLAGTETFEYGEKLAHVFDKEVVADQYFVSGATCTAKAVYKKSCICGEAGTETFEYGEKLAHVFDKEVATDAYLVSGATCTAKAVYNKSCFCGAKGTETFEVGEKLAHAYTEVVTKAPTCTVAGEKTFTCVCGDKKTEAIAATGAHLLATTTANKATLKANGAIVTKCTVCGTTTATTEIAKIGEVKLAKTKLTYNKKAQKPAPVVKDANGKTLTKNVDYTVSYAKGCKNIGKYKVTITFKGNYSGKKTLTFEIAPKGTKISKLTAAKKSLKVKIKKQTSNTTGYEVQYSLKKNFTSAKKKTVKKATTTSLTIKSLKAKKKYYVRVRTFKTVKGKKYYSDWSKAVSKKTK